MCEDLCDAGEPDGECYEHRCNAQLQCVQVPRNDGVLCTDDITGNTDLISNCQGLPRCAAGQCVVTGGLNTMTYCAVALSEAAEYLGASAQTASAIASSPCLNSVCTAAEEGDPPTCEFFFDQPWARCDPNNGCKNCGTSVVGPKNGLDDEPIELGDLGIFSSASTFAYWTESGAPAEWEAPSVPIDLDDTTLEVPTCATPSDSETTDQLECADWYLFDPNTQTVSGASLDFCLASTGNPYNAQCELTCVPVDSVTPDPSVSNDEHAVLVLDIPVWANCAAQTVQFVQNLCTMDSCPADGIGGWCRHAPVPDPNGACDHCELTFEEDDDTFIVGSTFAPTCLTCENCVDNQCVNTCSRSGLGICEERQCLATPNPNDDPLAGACSSTITPIDCKAQIIETQSQLTFVDTSDGSFETKLKACVVVNPCTNAGCSSSLNNSYCYVWMAAKLGLTSTARIPDCLKVSCNPTGSGPGADIPTGCFFAFDNGFCPSGPPLGSGEGQTPSIPSSNSGSSNPDEIGEGGGVPGNGEIPFCLKKACHPFNVGPSGEFIPNPNATKAGCAAVPDPTKFHRACEKEGVDPAHACTGSAKCMPDKAAGKDIFGDYLKADCVLVHPPLECDDLPCNPGMCVENPSGKDAKCKYKHYAADGVTPLSGNAVCSRGAAVNCNLDLCLEDPTTQDQIDQLPWLGHQMAYVDKDTHCLSIPYSGITEAVSSAVITAETVCANKELIPWLYISALSPGAPCPKSAWASCDASQGLADALAPACELSEVPRWIVDPYACTVLKCVDGSIWNDYASLASTICNDNYACTRDVCCPAGVCDLAPTGNPIHAQIDETVFHDEFGCVHFGDVALSNAYCGTSDGNTCNGDFACVYDAEGNPTEVLGPVQHGTGCALIAQPVDCSLDSSKCDVTESACWSSFPVKDRPTIVTDETCGSHSPANSGDTPMTTGDVKAQIIAAEAAKCCANQTSNTLCLEFVGAYWSSNVSTGGSENYGILKNQVDDRPHVGFENCVVNDQITSLDNCDPACNITTGKCKRHLLPACSIPLDDDESGCKDMCQFPTCVQANAAETAALNDPANMFDDELWAQFAMRRVWNNTCTAYSASKTSCNNAGCDGPENDVSDVECQNYLDLPASQQTLCVLPTGSQNFPTVPGDYYCRCTAVAGFQDAYYTCLAPVPLTSTDLCPPVVLSPEQLLRTLIPSIEHGNPYEDSLVMTAIGCSTKRCDSRTNDRVNIEDGQSVPNDACCGFLFANSSCVTSYCSEETFTCVYTFGHNKCQNGIYCDGCEACMPFPGQVYNETTGCISGQNPCFDGDTQLFGVSFQTGDQVAIRSPRTCETRTCNETAAKLYIKQCADSLAATPWEMANAFPQAPGALSPSAQLFDCGGTNPETGLDWVSGDICPVRPAECVDDECSIAQCDENKICRRRKIDSQCQVDEGGAPICPPEGGTPNKCICSRPQVLAELTPVGNAPLVPAPPPGPPIATPIPWDVLPFEVAAIYDGSGTLFSAEVLALIHAKTYDPSSPVTPRLLFLHQTAGADAGKIVFATIVGDPSWTGNGVNAYTIEAVVTDEENFGDQTPTHYISMVCQVPPVPASGPGSVCTVVDSPPSSTFQIRKLNKGQAYQGSQPLEFEDQTASLCFTAGFNTFETLGRYHTVGPKCSQPYRIFTSEAGSTYVERPCAYPTKFCFACSGFECLRSGQNVGGLLGDEQLPEAPARQTPKVPAVAAPEQAKPEVHGAEANPTLKGTNLTPQADCVSIEHVDSAGIILARFSYRFNDDKAGEYMGLPYSTKGVSNYVTIYDAEGNALAGSLNQGQPTVYVNYLTDASDLFAVPFTKGQRVVYSLNGREAILSASSRVCPSTVPLRGCDGRVGSARCPTVEGNTTVVVRELTEDEIAALILERVRSGEASDVALAAVETPAALTQSACVTVPTIDHSSSNSQTNYIVFFVGLGVTIVIIGFVIGVAYAYKKAAVKRQTATASAGVRMPRSDTATVVTATGNNAGAKNPAGVLKMPGSRNA